MVSVGAEIAHGTMCSVVERLNPSRFRLPTAEPNRTRQSWRVCPPPNDRAGGRCRVEDRTAASNTGAIPIGAEATGPHRAVSQCAVDVLGPSLSFATVPLPRSIPPGRGYLPEVSPDFCHRRICCAVARIPDAGFIENTLKESRRRPVLRSARLASDAMLKLLSERGGPADD